MNWWESDPVSGGTAVVATPPQNNWWENDPATTATAPPQPQLSPADIGFSLGFEEQPVQQQPVPTLAEQTALSDLQTTPDTTYGGRYDSSIRPTQQFIDQYNNEQKIIGYEPPEQKPQRGGYTEALMWQLNKYKDDPAMTRAILENSVQQDVANQPQYPSKHPQQDFVGIPQGTLDRLLQQYVAMPEGSPERTQAEQLYNTAQQQTNQLNSIKSSAQQHGLTYLEEMQSRQPSQQLRRSVADIPVVGQPALGIFQGLEGMGETAGNLMLRLSSVTPLTEGLGAKADENNRVRQLVNETLAKTDKSRLGTKVRDWSDLFTKLAVTGGTAGHAAIIPVFSAEIYDKTYTADKDRGMSRAGAAAHAAGTAAIQGALMYMAGNVGKQIGLLPREELMTPAMAKAVQNLFAKEGLEAATKNVLFQAGEGGAIQIGTNMLDYYTGARANALDPDVLAADTARASAEWAGMGVAGTAIHGFNQAMGKFRAKLPLVLNGVKTAEDLLIKKVDEGRPISRTDLERLGIPTKKTNASTREAIARQYVDAMRLRATQNQTTIQPQDATFSYSTEAPAANIRITPEQGRELVLPEEPTNATIQGQQPENNQQEYQQAPGRGLRTEKVDSNSAQQGGQVQEEVAQEVTGRPWITDYNEPQRSYGWKLHLSTDSPEEVSQILSKLDMRHKVGRSGGQEGKDITVYSGSREGAEAAAREISNVAGSLLKTASQDVQRDDVLFAGNVWGRFTAGDRFAEGRGFHQYGTQGLPYLDSDMMRVQRGEISHEQARQNARDAINKNPQLRERYFGKQSEVTPLAGRVPQGDLVRETVDTLSAAPTPEGKVSNEIPEQAQGVPTETQAETQGRQEGLLDQPPGQPTPVAPLTTDKSAAPTEALPDWVTEDQPIVPPAEADRPKATPKETTQVRRTIKGLLERGVVNEQEAELLRGMHPHDVQAMLNQARELSDGDSQYKQELRNEFNALFGTTGAKEQEVQQIITKDGKKRTRKVSAAGRKSAQARMIERNGGDPASIPGFDEAVQQLDLGLYPNLAGYASSLGNGDMEAGLFAILQGGAKQFETAEADSQFRDILDQYHAVQERESAGRAEDNRVAETGDTVQGSAAEGGAVNEDFALSGEPKAEPAEFQNTATRQPNLIQDLQRDSLPGQQNIPGFDTPDVKEAAGDIESALGIAPKPEAKPGRAPERVLSADEQQVVGNLGQNYGVEAQPRGPQNEAEQWAVDTAAKLNRTVVFVDGLPETYNGNVNPDFPNVIVIRSGANATESVLTHELTHATGIDTIQKLAPELWEAAKQLRLDKASDAYRVRLVGDENGNGKQEGLLDREGVAEISGQFATDPKFREDMAKKHGKLYDVLRKSALKVIAKLLPKGGEFTVEGKKVVAKTARGRALEKVAQIELLQAFQKEFRRTAANVAKNGAMELSERGPNILLSEDKPDLWYAKSANIIEDKKFTKGSPGEVKKMLENGGVKPEELDWMGLSELLGPNTGKKTVTKDELLAAIRGGVQIQEVVKGGDEKQIQDAVDRLAARGYEVEADMMEQGVTLSSDGRYVDPTTLTGQDLRDFELLESVGPASGGDSTKFSQWQLSGGENYRELLLTLPIPDTMSWEPGYKQAKASVYHGPHYDEPNVLAHLRFNDRVDADGKKVLFIEEVQSDWHQAGRENGYASDEEQRARQKRVTELLDQIEKIYGQLDSDIHDAHEAVRTGEFANATDEWSKRNTLSQLQDINGKLRAYGVANRPTFVDVLDRQSDFIQNKYRELANRHDRLVAELDAVNNDIDRTLYAVPNAPFKKTWPLLAMKRAIQWAAENGYDRIAWTTGEQQNERYDLSKHVGNIAYVPFSDGSYAVSISDKMNGNPDLDLSIAGSKLPNKDSGRTWYNIPADKLEDLVGKEIASKMQGREGMANPIKWDNNPTGENLRVLSGGDLRVGGSGMKGFYDDILPKEVNKFIKKFGAKVGKTEFDPLTKAQAFAEATVAGGKRTPYFDAHAFDITPEMRDSAIKYGQPLFSEDKPFDHDKARQGFYKAITEAQTLTELRSRLKSVYGQDVPVDAIRKAVEKVRAYARPELLADMGMAGARKAPTFPTGIKKAAVDAEREQLGLPPLPQSEGQKFEQWNDSARATLDRNPDAGRQILNEVSQVDRPLTAREAAIITVHKAQLINRQNDLAAQHIKAVEAGDTQAARELDDAQNIVSDQIQELNAIVRDANSEAGRSLVALKMMVNEDYTLAKMEDLYRSANGGERLTPDQKQKIADMHAEIQRLKAELEQVKQQQVDKSINLGRKRVKGHEVNDADAAKSRFRQGLESLAKKLKLPFSGASIRLSEDADITGDLRQLADDAIGAGVTNFREFIDALESGVGSKLTEDYRSQLEKVWDAAAVAAEAVDKKFSPDDVRIDEDTTSVELATIAKKLSKYFDEHEGIRERRHNVEAVYNFLKEFKPDITRQETMDAIADYGKVRELNKDPVEVRYRQRRGEIQAVRKLIDMLEGNPPKITGTEKESPGPTKRSIDRLVNNFKRALNIQPTDPAKQASSALSAAKRRIANHIYDLKQAIKAQAPLTRKRATNFGSDPEYAALKADLDQWQARYDEIFKKPELTDAQRIELAIKATERMTAEYGRRIQEGDFLTIRRDLPPSAALDAAKAKRDAVKSLYQELRAFDPQYHAQELLKAARQRERRLTERAERLINRMQSGDFGPRHTSRMNWVPTQREAQIQAAIDGIVRAFNEEVGKARNIRRWTKDIEDIKQQIQTGAFTTPSPRAEKVLSNEEMRLLVQRKTLKQQRDIKLEERNRSAVKRLWNNSTGLLRTVLTTGELSPVLRQGGKSANAAIGGLWLGDVSDLRTFAKALYKTHRALFSPKYAAEQDAQIFNNPRLGVWSHSGLRIAHRGEHIFGPEEVRMPSDIESLPIIRNFGDAARVFFNTLRTESFDSMASVYGDSLTQEQAKSIANFINSSTGYAKLGRAEAAAGVANELLFSARNLAANYQWLTLEPLRHSDPTTRKLIAKQYAKTIMGLATATAIAAMAGASIDKDPRSADFLKWRFGNTRIDPLMGLSQLMVFLSREITGETKDVGGVVRYLRKNYRPLSFFRTTSEDSKIKASSSDGAGVAWRFLRSKFSPNISLIVNFLAGKDVVGQEFSLTTQAGNLVPMTYMDIYKEMQEQGLARGTAIALMAFYGYGLQTYATPKPKKQKVIY